MANTYGNNTTLAFGIEPSPNTEPSATPATAYLLPNSFPSFGPQPERLTADPIGPNAMSEAGTTIKTPAAIGVEGDFVRDNWRPFLPGAMRAVWSTTPRRYFPTSVRSTDYVVPANGALVEGTLIIVRGCATAANNGLKVVGAGSDGTHIVTSGLTAEAFTAGQGVTVEVCGFQFAAGDAEIDASGNFKTTTKNLTDFGIPAGQTIWIGGDTTATKFATAAHRGQARVSIAPAAALLTLDGKTTGTFPAATADNGSGKTIQIFYGPFAKVAATTDATFYAEPSYQLEVAHATLAAGSPSYEYTTGCYVENYRVSLPTSTKATLSVGMQGLVAVAPSASRRTSFSAPVRPNARALLNTGNHIRRGRVQYAAADMHGVVFTADLTIANELTVLYGHGSNDAVGVAFGDRLVTGSVNAFFSVADAIAALVVDTTLNADWYVRSAGDSWGVVFDIPALQLTSAPRQIDANQPTKVTLEFKAVRDATYNTLLMVSDFPYAPAP